jgi:hypothetical protein
MDEEFIERLKVREVIDNWVLYRDANMWDRFRTCWAPNGRMNATWTQGTFEEFIEMNKSGFAKGVRILHYQGPSSVDINGNRAVAFTKMVISQRAKVHDVWCDVNCTGRFCDFLEKNNGKWGIVNRQPIYEKDRMDPVDPAAKLTLDQELLAKFPEGYRHLAYLQTQIGYKVKIDMPGWTGPEVEALYERGRAWLAGAQAKAAEGR